MSLGRNVTPYVGLPERIFKEYSNSSWIKKKKFFPSPKHWTYIRIHGYVYMHCYSYMSAKYYIQVSGYHSSGSDNLYTYVPTHILNHQIVYGTHVNVININYDYGHFNNNKLIHSKKACEYEIDLDCISAHLQKGHERNSICL